MTIGGPIRPLSQLEEMELRRERLQELVHLGLVSPTLDEQIRKSVVELDQQIQSLQMERLRWAA